MVIELYGRINVNVLTKECYLMIKIKFELWNRRVLMRREMMLRLALEGKTQPCETHPTACVKLLKAFESTRCDKINSLIALIIEFVNRGQYTYVCTFLSRRVLATCWANSDVSSNSSIVLHEPATTDHVFD